MRMSFRPNYRREESRGLSWIRARGPELLSNSVGICPLASGRLHRPPPVSTSWRPGSADAADPCRRTALDPRRTALDPRRTALDPRRTALDPRRTALDPRRTALDPRRTALDPRRTAL